MLAVLSGGGTAGHINPAIATAEVLRERGVDVRFAGRPEGRESEWVRAAGIPFEQFESAGFNRTHPTTLAKALPIIEKSTKRAVKWFKQIDPDVVVGFGGYVAIPVCRAAVKLGIPVVIHEQNSVMGMTNKYLSDKAKTVCLTYENAANQVKDRSKVKITGCPVRSSIFTTTREEGRARLGVPESARMLLVTGGSLGARHLNEALCTMKQRLLAYDDLHVVHVTGPKELDSVKSSLALTEDEAARWQLFGYTNDMPACMAAADMIVSRSGASSLAEISALGIPAILVPYPHATADHQTTNARAYVDAGCARMIADSEVETPEFVQMVCNLVEDGALRDSMRAAARARKTEDAARALADEVMAVCS